MTKKLDDVENIAKALNITVRRVQQLVQEGVLSKTARGKYNLTECVRNYDNYLKQLGQTSQADEYQLDPEANSDLNKEKLRLTKAKADKAELEMKILEGEYISVNNVEFEWSNLLIAFRSKMLAIPVKFAPRLINITSAATIQRMLEDEIYAGLLELSKYNSNIKNEPSSTS